MSDGILSTLGRSPESRKTAREPESESSRAGTARALPYRKRTGRRLLAPSAAALAALGALSVGAVSRTTAQAPPGPRSTSALSHRPQALPEPEAQEPVLAYEVHAGVVAPLATGPICPSGAACVLGGGGGVGALVLRRWPSGLTVGVGYDAWFVDSGSVFELGTLHAVRAVVRHAWLAALRVHPFAGGAVGAMGLGDLFRVSAFGLALDAEIGVEVELTGGIPSWPPCPAGCLPPGRSSRTGTVSRPLFG